MRFACILAAIGTVLLSGVSLAQGFEIEERVVYDATQGDAEIQVLSTADRAVFEPILLAFQAENPSITIDYTIASTREVMKAVEGGDAQFDLIISSAMDLQTKLANDGFAQTHRSDATLQMPDWARWRDQIFAFTQEPAVLIVSKSAFPNGNVPTSREALIALLRDEPERFLGRVGTYDVRTSGFGYLMATQDARMSESFWRLLEVMGRLEPRLYCCSGAMIQDIRSGKLALAYNVLGSYAAGELARTGGFEIVVMEDFANVMLRTALIASNAKNVDEAKIMIDFLVSLDSRPDLIEASGLPALDADQLAENAALRPIRLGPGLLVFLDRLKRQSFLRSWEASITQN